MKTNLTTKAVNKFWQLARARKNAALDVNTLTGEIVCQYTQSLTSPKYDGTGLPSVPYTSKWQRIALCHNGKVTEGWHLGDTRLQGA